VAGGFKDQSHEKEAGINFGLYGSEVGNRNS
jgi:hypothetical protein